MLNEEMGEGQDIVKKDHSALLEALFDHRTIQLSVALAFIAGFGIWANVTNETSYSLFSLMSSEALWAQSCAFMYFGGLALIAFGPGRTMVVGWASSLLGVVVFWLNSDSMRPYDFARLDVGIGQIIGVLMIIILAPLVYFNMGDR